MICMLQTLKNKQVGKRKQVVTLPISFSWVTGGFRLENNNSFLFRLQIESDMWKINENKDIFHQDSDPTKYDQLGELIGFPWLSHLKTMVVFHTADGIF